MRLHRRVWLAILLAAMALTGGQAAAEETWAVRSGVTTVHMTVPLLQDLGVEFRDVKPTAQRPADVLMEAPNWTFIIEPTSDLSFRTVAGVPVPGGIVGGAIRHRGAFTLINPENGRRSDIQGPEIAYIDPKVYAPADHEVLPSLYLRAHGADSPLLFELHDSMFQFDRETRELRIHYLNARINERLAEQLGRPELAGWFVGMAKVVAQVELVSSTGTEPEPYVPNFTSGILDVKLGILENIQQRGHDGVHPNGIAGISMATTSCNVGTVDVPWLAPMQEDHPLIHMALYRLLDGRFEQVGVSWMKHGFFALSNSQCTPCEHPSGGQFLGVGCSDTYGVGNNSDRNYLGPRSEVDAYQGTWECTASHFAGGQNDCIRRHGSSGHGSSDHMLTVSDADLNNSNATYFYESYYVVRGDENKINNWGSRRCTMSWNGSVWQFVTPASNNPLLEGPALVRWGDRQTLANAAPGDGEVMLAVTTTDLGGGMHRYEYALLNKDSEREIRSFSLPVIGVAGITNIGFHDNDQNAGNDWQVTLDGFTLSWSTQTFDENPNANSLVFGYQYNFRFDAAAKPTDVTATLGLFRPGAGNSVTMATNGPTNTVLAVDGGAPGISQARLLPARPNPFANTVTIPLELATAADVRLDIYDAAGRLVRNLRQGPVGAGASDMVWDGKGSDHNPVRAGVYYARLSIGGQVAVQPMVLLK
jgi:FlgD Ig-like domain